MRFVEARRHTRRSRRFESGERNSCSRYPWAACSSSTRNPACCARVAASRKPARIRAIPCGVESLRAGIVGPEGDRARRVDRPEPAVLARTQRAASLPRLLCRALAPGVRRAASPRRRLASSMKPDDARELRHVLVLPDAQVLRRRSAPSGVTAARLGEHQRRSADGAGAEVDEVPVVREPVLARVLAHGRDDDPVAQRRGREAGEARRACA